MVRFERDSEYCRAILLGQLVWMQQRLREYEIDCL